MGGRYARYIFFSYYTSQHHQVRTQEFFAFNFPPLAALKLIHSCLLGTFALLAPFSRKDIMHNSSVLFLYRGQQTVAVKAKSSVVVTAISSLVIIKEVANASKA